VDAGETGFFTVMTRTVMHRNALPRPDVGTTRRGWPARGQATGIAYLSSSPRLDWFGAHRRAVPGDDASKESAAQRHKHPYG
jgi:hypothetical protein